MPAAPARAFSDLADLTIGAALDAVVDEFAVRHGKVPGGRVAILGMGKLGSRELTAGSDVDLILLYDHDADADESDGEKPLAPVALLRAADAAADRGGLGADRGRRTLRTRPPAAALRQQGAGRDACRRVQEISAQRGLDLGAHGADARARPIAGDAELARRGARRRSRRCSRCRATRGRCFKEAAEMRALIEKEKPPRNFWDIKLVPGGLIDLEFIAQCAVLTGNIQQWRRRAQRAPPTLLRGWRPISPTRRRDRNSATRISSMYR